MTKLLRLIAALALVLTMTMGCSAFVVPVRSAAAPVPTKTAVVPTTTTTTTLHLGLGVDPAISAMMANVPPIGSIIMLLLVGTLFEVYTPGRAKK
jgi:hypothetical protein